MLTVCVVSLASNITVTGENEVKSRVKSEEFAVPSLVLSHTE